MNIIISNVGNQPIYDQIYQQIKQAILAGDLTAGTALPSIRSLAKDLRVSVITTKRAYEELEKDGFLYPIPAKGCFVAPKNVELLREEIPCFTLKLVYDKEDRLVSALLNGKKIR